MISLTHYLVLSAILFSLGFYGVLVRRSAILILISVELMLAAVSINFVAFASYVDTDLFSGIIFAIFVIAIAAAEVGLALGFPALRVQTIYLAFATLGFNTALWLVMRNEEWLTGGTFGINNIARPELFGLDLSSNLKFYYFILGVTIIMCALLWKLLHSPWGKAFTALRDNPIRAESLGVNIQAYTLLSFAIGAVYAGVAGALFAPLVEFIEPAPFTVGASIMMYLMVVVGGAGYFWGPLLGSAVGVILPEWLRFAQGWYLFVFGTAVVLLMLWLPDGLLSIPDKLRAKRVAREASAARSAAAAKLGAQS